MPSILRHVECGACGHRHNFCLPAGDLDRGREYEYVCPETARRHKLRPDASAEPAHHYLQGAVELEDPSTRTVDS